MSYNQGYGQNGGGRGDYHPYGQPNPYDQRDDNQYSGGYNSAPQGYPQGYPQGNQYSQPDNYNQQRPPYQQHSSSRYDEEQAQGGYEMGAVGGGPNDDRNRLLKVVKALNDEVDVLENDTQKLEGLRKQYLADPSTDSRLRDEVKSQSEDIMDRIRRIVQRATALRQDPDSLNPRNAPQIGKLQRRIDDFLKDARTLETKYRVAVDDQFDRGYRIVRPDASPQEIREARESTSGTQIFSQALLNTDRRGEAQKAKRRVQQRHDDIQEIEKKFLELHQLTNDLANAVVQQEDQVVAIEDKADVAQEHVTQGTVQLDAAIVKAKAARKKKWICLGICVLIIIIVIAVAVGVVEANKSRNTT